MKPRALRQSIKQEPTVLTSEEYAAVDAGQASFERGEGMSFDEALELARERTRAWTSITLKDLAAKSL
jgi:hypothetical protein